MLFRPALARFACAAALLCWLVSCRHPAPAPALAFYYWQTTFRLSATERQYLDNLHCRMLYVKFLDIGRDPDLGDIRPFAQLDIRDTAGLGGRSVVPTVFLTNAIFQNINAEKIDWLAQKTAAALQRIAARCPPGTVGAQYQFDCDWTPSTRQAFFLFLQKIRPCLPPGSQLSATIRLHQYKAPRQTGVPPVERGMLMLYNTGDLDDPAEEHSIFQPADAQRYLVGAPVRYPLPLDVALPIFSWALVYRDDALWKILPNPGPAAWSDTGRFEATGPQRFRIRQGTFAGGHYLRPNDRLRLEAVDLPLLGQAARLASGIRLADDATVAFFHLDSTTVQRYPVAQLDSIGRIFQQ